MMTMTTTSSAEISPILRLEQALTAAVRDGVLEGKLAKRVLSRAAETRAAREASEAFLFQFASLVLKAVQAHALRWDRDVWRCREGLGVNLARASRALHQLELLSVTPAEITRHARRASGGIAVGWRRRHTEEAHLRILVLAVDLT